MCPLGFSSRLALNWTNISFAYDVFLPSSYDNVDKAVPDAFSHLLEEIHKLESELGHLPQKWKVLWDKLEIPLNDSLTVSKMYVLTKLRIFIGVDLTFWINLVPRNTLVYQ